MGVAIQDQDGQKNTAKCDSEPRDFRYLFKFTNAAFGRGKFFFKGALAKTWLVAIMSHEGADDRSSTGEGRVRSELYEILHP